MIADARTMSHPAHRPNTVLGALAHVLDQLDVGESLLLEGAICSNGEPARVSSIRPSISNLSYGRRFVTRREGGGFRVHRIE